MGDVAVPDELPCEKCGEMTAYNGLIGAKLSCEHCGTPRPHTMRGATGRGSLIFLIFFVVAILIVLIFKPGDASILIFFPIFLLIYLILFARFVIVGLRMKREAKKKAAQENHLHQE